jgi:hypothetical protein
MLFELQTVSLSSLVLFAACTTTWVVAPFHPALIEPGAMASE